MADLPPITLRYFDVRGRAQFIRALLAAREIPFVDERVQLSADLSSWQETRNDRGVSGSFQKMPTLQWGDTMVGEVLVILDFLHRQLGDAELLGEDESLKHSMLISSVFLDMLTPPVNLIWCDIFNPGVDLEKTVPIVKGRLVMHMATVNQTLKDWNWNQSIQKRPVMASDAVLWEALDMVRVTFNGKIDLGDFDELQAFYENCPGKKVFQELLEQHPATITARPGEAEALLKIHQYL